MDICYDESWGELFDKWDIELGNILRSIYKDNNKIIYPPREQIFRVFLMPLDNINIVLLGQDPYHGENQANGLAFSVNKGILIPPSLQNIFKEIKNEFPERNYEFKHGDLTNWQDNEGIFLLNTSLTVNEHTPKSHSKLWFNFTNDVISYISQKSSTSLFILLGADAKNKEQFIYNKMNILKTSHPSPLSANTGFFGSNIFKNAEIALSRQINWQN